MGRAVIHLAKLLQRELSLRVVLITRGKVCFISRKVHIHTVPLAGDISPHWRGRRAGGEGRRDRFPCPLKELGKVRPLAAKLDGRRAHDESKRAKHGLD